MPSSVQVPARRRWTLAEVRALMDANPLATPRYELVDGETLVKPDVFVVPPDEAKRLRHEMPARKLTLVIEVLSPSSARFDRGEKRKLYQRHVPEYWIVDLDARLFERWRPGAPHPEILHDSIDWRPLGTSAALELSLPEFFARVFDEPI